MKTLGDRARARRLELKLSQAEIARLAGITQPSLSDLENNKSKDTNNLWQLAQALQCDPEWLASGNRRSGPQNQDTKTLVYIKNTKILPENTPKLRNTVESPIVPDNLKHIISLGPRDLPVRGLAQGGNGMMTFEQDAIDYTFRPSNLIGINDAFALYVTGDSMGEVLLPGTLLLVHPRQEPKIMDFVVIEKLDHSVIVKRLIRRTATTVTLREYDPPNDFTLDRAQIRTMLRVCGTHIE